MRLKINGEWKDCPDDLSVADLLDELDIEQTRGVALARNDHVVPRSRWADEALEDEDRIEIIRATQGG